jgi:NitT/TauT family transport system substrate-binding protein
MKKRFLSVLICVAMLAGLATGCGSNSSSSADESAAATESTTTEKTTIKMGVSQVSGQILQAIAEDKGFLEDEGVEIELVTCDTAQDAFTALASGKIDIVSTYGTNRPIQYIGEGEDITIFGGYMLTGAMPIVAKKGTEWNGVEDLIGKTVAGNTTYYAVCGPLLDLGYDPTTEVTWVDLDQHIDRLEAVRSDEADFAIVGTGYAETIEDMDLEIVCYLSDILPDYSCCRVVANTEWLNNNQDAAKAMMKAWLRAEQVYESDKDYAISLVAEQLDVTEEHVSAYVNEPHYVINLDPDYAAVEKAWNYMGQLGLLGENAENVNIKDHFDSSVYKAALDECIEEYYDEDPDFYDYYQNFYEENTAIAE